MTRDIATQNVIANIPAMFCAAIAGILAALGADGWGWMIFLSMCMVVTVRRRTTSSTDGK
jgi:hypothetical protein